MFYGIYLLRRMKSVNIEEVIQINMNKNNDKLL